MKRLYRLFSPLIALAILASFGAAGSAESASLPQQDDYFTTRDLSGEWDATATRILLTGDSAESSAHVVSVDGGTVTIMDGGTYVLSGTLEDGTIIVDVDDDERVQLVLNGVSITSSSTAAIRVVQADKVFITLAEGTENTLASTAFESEDVNAVIFSDEDLTFNGTGTLIIDSPAGKGIDGKDDVKFASGTYVITAAGRGIDANDSVRIAGGDFTITADGDAIRAKHDTNADLGYIYIWGGTFNITTGGGAANAAAHSGDMFSAMGGGMGQGGGMRGGFGRRGFNRDSTEDETTTEGDTTTKGTEDGETPDFSGMTPPEFTGEDGETPDFSDMTPPDFTGEDGETRDFSDMTPPDFTGEDGEMPDFSSMTPPDFTGEDGEMPDFAQGGGMGPGGFGFQDSAQDEEDTVSAKGFKASGEIFILGGTFNLDTADDAFHADASLTIFDGDINVTSGDDGIHADGTLAILGGAVNISQSYEGLEGTVIDIEGGDIAVYASDDGLNAADSEATQESFDAQEGVLIQISGGALYVNADGDGIDSNGDLLITGGSVVVSGPSNGANGALDYNGTATITGGTVVAAGASGMAESFSDTSTQAAFLVSLSGEAGEITVSDSERSVLLTAEVEDSFATVVVSSPELVVGETYTVTAGDSSAEITLTDTVTGRDSGGFGGGFGGMGMRGGR